MFDQIRLAVAGAFLVVVVIAGVGWQRASTVDAKVAEVEADASAEVIAAQVKLRQAERERTRAVEQLDSASDAIRELDARVNSTETEGRQADRSLTERERDVVADRAAIDAFQAQLAASGAELEQRQTDLDTRQAELDQRQADLDAYQAQLTQAGTN